MLANTEFSKYQNGKISISLRCVMIGIAVILGSGCASTEVIENNPQENIAGKKVDPYEGFNRKMYNFNDKVDNYVAEPISNGYKKITPQFVQTGVFNFFNNLKNINVVINDVLQAKFSQSAQDTGRFAMNSTLGLAGLFDVAKHVGLEQNDEDFEQTLAVWGVPQGSYLVLPFLGPSTARGIPGSVFDTAANPTTYVGLPVQLLSMLNTRASADGSLKFIDEAALDPYVFTRESFLQWRNNLATDGKSEATSGFDDELDDGESDAASSSTQKSAGDGKKVHDDSPSLTGAKKADFASQPQAENKELGQASKSLSNVSQSFDQASKSFEEADRKLDLINKANKNKSLKQ
ncbi:MAG: VacJ family lipoprotein [Methylococcaceae bacterium]|nr:VacJ family lipoprotein [Methylococcaceae bacterium]